MNVREPIADILAEVFDDCFKSVEETMATLQLDTATGAELDDCAATYVGLTRREAIRQFGTLVGAETDDQFRKRIEDTLAIDGDARFAAKLEPEVEKWDEEEREAKL